MKCLLCDSQEIKKIGKTTHGSQKYSCEICNHIFTSNSDTNFTLPQINFLRFKENHLIQFIQFNFTLPNKKIDKHKNLSIKKLGVFFEHVNRAKLSLIKSIAIDFIKQKQIIINYINKYKQIVFSLFQRHKNIIFLFAFLAVILIYITPNTDPTAPQVLAKELLRGKPYLPEKSSWMEMLVWEDHFYIAYPPMVTFLVLPYVLLGGEYLGGSAINSIMLFGAAIFLFLLVKRLEGIKQWASLAAIAYILGTTNFHSAHIGSVWLLMHSQGNFFLLLALWLFISKRSYFAAGMSFAIAFQVRYAILAAIIVFPLYAFLYFLPMPTKSQWRKFILGIIPPCLMSWSFQWWTLGNPFTSPYTIAWQQWGEPEPIFSLKYLPHNLEIYFLGIPKLLHEFPYLHFEFEGQAMWVISPFLLGVLFLNFRHRFVLAFLPSTIVMLIAYLCYFHPGTSQYGTRYVQDIFPLLIPLAFAGFTHRKLWLPALLPMTVLISCLINSYAVFFALKVNWS